MSTLLHFKIYNDLHERIGERTKKTETNRYEKGRQSERMCILNLPRAPCAATRNQSGPSESWTNRDEGLRNSVATITFDRANVLAKIERVSLQRSGVTDTISKDVELQPVQYDQASHQAEGQTYQINRF